jgi:hypothetical protein
MTDGNGKNSASHAFIFIAACNYDAPWSGLGASPPAAQWSKFQSYLSHRCNSKTTAERIRYTKQYLQVLTSGDAQELLEITPEKRLNVLKALSSYARFTGRYNEFLDIRKRYGFKWQDATAEKKAIFENLFIDESTKNLQAMMHWVRQVRRTYPDTLGNILLFSCMVGLRSSECLESIKLIKNQEKFREYYDRDKKMLLHARFPALFSRRTKHAFVSVVDDEIVEIAQNSMPRSYGAIQMQLERDGFDMRLSYTRKIFSTYLHQHANVPHLLIDALQGRISSGNLFLNNYFRPDDSYKDKVLQAVHQLKREIEAQ